MSLKRALALLLACAGMGAAHAQSSGSPAFCDRLHPLNASQQDKLLRFAAIVRAELETAEGAADGADGGVLVSRSGLDLSPLRYPLLAHRPGLARKHRRLVGPPAVLRLRRGPPAHLRPGHGGVCHGHRQSLSRLRLHRAFAAGRRRLPARRRPRHAAGLALVIEHLQRHGLSLQPALPELQSVDRRIDGGGLGRSCRRRRFAGAGASLAGAGAVRT